MTNKILKYVGLGILIIIVGFIVIGKNRSDAKIRIGVVAPFSGASAAFGEYVGKGIDMALNKIPLEKRGQIEIIKEDDACNGQSAISAVRKLIELDKVNYIIGPMCNESSIATERLIEDNEVVSLSIGLPSNKIANMGKYHFTLAPEIENLMRELARNMIKQNLKRVAIIHMSVAFEDENYRHFVKYFNEFGGIIVADEAKIKGSTDFRDSVLKVKQANPDSLMLIAHTGDLNNILEQISVQGLGDLPKFGTHAAETPVLLQKKDLAEGLIYPYPADATNYGQDEKDGLAVATAITVDSLGALLEALNKCDYTDKSCVLNYLSNLKDYKGVNGVLSVDSRGVGTYKDIMIKIVKGGKFVRINTDGKSI